MTKRIPRAVREQRTIRGIKGDRVTITVTPDPLDEALGLPPIPLLHLSVTDAYGDSANSDGLGKNANVVGVFTLDGARKLHQSLGALLLAARMRRP